MAARVVASSGRGLRDAAAGDDEVGIGRLAGQDQLALRGLLGRDRGGEVGAGGGEPRLQVAVVEDDEDVAGLHDLVVLDQDLGDLSGHAGAHAVDVPLDIGVVRRFLATPEEPAHASGCQGGHDQERQEDLGA